MNLAFRRGPVTFGDVVYAPGGTLGPRRQRDFQMVILHSGTLVLRVDGQSHTLAPGLAVLLAPGGREMFTFAAGQESRHTWCTIEQRAVPAGLRAVFREVRGPAAFSGPMAALLEAGLAGPRPFEGPEELEARYLLGLGLALFCDFARCALTGPAGGRPGDTVISRVEQFISRELGRPLGLADLARAGGVSRQHLLKLFRDRGRETPTRLLFARRLDAARDWLAHTGLSIGEISERCGFANAFHFSRKFRQAHGMSPRAWRARAWES